MLERIKKRWNSGFTNSLFFIALSIFASAVEQDVDKSLMFFGVAMVSLGLGEVINEIKELNIYKDKKDAK